MSGVARDDGFADYYDEHLRDFTLSWTDVLERLLEARPGRCLDLGDARFDAAVSVFTLLQAFVGAGLALAGFEEPGDGLYPRVLAVVGHRS